jgi:O-antigen/teichoic acid export membrane protein
MVAMVFHAGVLTMVMRTLQIPFAALITADERMSFFSCLGLFEAFCTIATAFAAYAGVTAFVVVLVLSAVAVFMLHAMFCHRKFPFLRMRISCDGRCLTALGTFISWSTLGGIGNVLKYRGTGVVINIYAGVAFSASWKISLEVWSLLYALCTSFQQAFCPAVFKAWGTRPCKEFVRLTKITTTISFLIAGMPAMILFVFADEFLLLWLGESTAPQLTQFVRCALVNLVFDAISCPLTAAIDATGRIVCYQIVTSSLSTLALITASALLVVGMPPWTAMGAVATCNGLACVYRFFHVRGIVCTGESVMSCANRVSSSRTDA